MGLQLVSPVHSCLIVYLCIGCLHRKHHSSCRASIHRAVAGIDVTQDDAWEGVRKAVATRHIDVLILNAGILIKDDLADIFSHQDTLLEQVSSLWPSWF